MRYAIVKDDIIENVIVADREFIDEHYPNAIECPLAYGVGDQFIDGEFIKIQIPVIDDESVS